MLLQSTQFSCSARQGFLKNMTGNNVPDRGSSFGTLSFDMASHKAMFFAYHTKRREVQGYFKSIHQLKVKVIFFCWLWHPTINKPTAELLRDWNFPSVHMLAWDIRKLLLCMLRIMWKNKLLFPPSISHITDTHNKGMLRGLRSVWRSYIFFLIRIWY